MTTITLTKIGILTWDGTFVEGAIEADVLKHVYQNGGNILVLTYFFANGNPAFRTGAPDDRTIGCYTLDYRGDSKEQCRLDLPNNQLPCNLMVFELALVSTGMTTHDVPHTPTRIHIGTKILNLSKQQAHVRSDGHNTDVRLHIDFKVASFSIAGGGGDTPTAINQPWLLARRTSTKRST